MECQNLKLCYAIIVSFNPIEDIISNVIALLNQVNEVVIIDNGSNANSKKYLEILSKNYGIHVIYNNENLGIATALNIGAKYGISKGYYWIATFDQDSRVPDRYIDAILNAYENCDYKEKVAIISPRYFNSTTGKVYSYSKKKIDDKLFSDVQTTITSGNLVKLSIFSDVGFFDEDFFIDYVDNEFCLRCRKNGLKIIEANDLFLVHNLGMPSVHNLLGIQITATNHSPVRRYYKYRNMITVYQRYFLFDCLWVLSDMKYFLSEPIKIILFEKEKISKVYNIFRGIIHGLKGIKGKYISS